jgi:hypothetical protein
MYNWRVKNKQIYLYSKKRTFYYAMSFSNTTIQTFQTDFRRTSINSTKAVETFCCN